MSRTVRKVLPQYGEKYDTTRDKKKKYKPPKWYKKMKNKRRKAKVKDAIIKGKEIPNFKHTDTWEWN